MTILKMPSDALPLRLAPFEFRAGDKEHFQIPFKNSMEVDKNEERFVKIDAFEHVKNHAIDNNLSKIRRLCLQFNPKHRQSSIFQINGDGTKTEINYTEDYAQYFNPKFDIVFDQKTGVIIIQIIFPNKDDEAEEIFIRLHTALDNIIKEKSLLQSAINIIPFTSNDEIKLVNDVINETFQSIAKILEFHFFNAVKAGYCQVWAKINLLGKHEIIPSDVFESSKVTSWENGEAQLRDGTMLYDVQIAYERLSKQVMRINKISQFKKWLLENLSKPHNFNKEELFLIAKNDYSMPKRKFEETYKEVINMPKIIPLKRGRPKII